MYRNWIGEIPFLAAVGLLSTYTSGFTVETETRLRLDKLTNYTVDVRPSHRTKINMSFTLTAISGVDMKNQVFSVAGWWSMYWTDLRLAWSVRNYNDIPVLQIFEDKIWTPTVVVDNSVNDLSAIDEDNIPLRVDKSGSVIWNPPGLISVSCDMDVTHFPFDTQVCSLQVTSFGYTIQVGCDARAMFGLVEWLQVTSFGYTIQVGCDARAVFGLVEWLQVTSFGYTIQVGFDARAVFGLVEWLQVTSFGYTIQVGFDARAVFGLVEWLRGVTSFGCTIRVSDARAVFGLVEWLQVTSFGYTIQVGCDARAVFGLVEGLQVTSFGYTIQVGFDAQAVFGLVEGLQELDLYVYEDGINLNYFSGNGEWTLLSIWHERTTYIEAVNEYARIYYYFKVKRKPLFYGLTHLLPVMVTAFLTVFVFVLPAESGEKISYSLTVLLSFMVILTLIADDLPPTASNASLLELFIALVFIMGALAVVLSIYVVEVYYRQDSKPASGVALHVTRLYMRIASSRRLNVCCSRRVEPEKGCTDQTVFYDAQNKDRLFTVRNNYTYTKTKADSNGFSKTESRPSQKSQLRRKHTLPILHLPVPVQSEPEDLSRVNEISWQTVSAVLDCLLLRFYIVFLSVSSAVFLTLLTWGG
ncbi:hypothetical protein RRG08_036295 [Elysia crispata]|uniref:Uncharacterized protein n=1 Tax=Elysia crispata TaxID=231223 RepID=A0AAE0ZU53_9GAST|nr:hypothetical protein RRG08_036295 [Elysia crispata]